MKLLTAILISSTLFLREAKTQNLQENKLFNIKVTDVKQTSRNINQNNDNAKVYFNPTSNNLKIDFGNGDIALLGKQARLTNQIKTRNPQRYQLNNDVQKISQTKISQGETKILGANDNLWKELNQNQKRNIQVKSNIQKPTNYRGNFGSYGNQQIYQNNIDRRINSETRWNGKQYETYEFQYGRNYPHRQSRANDFYSQTRKNDNHQFNKYQDQDNWLNKRGRRYSRQQQNRKMKQNRIQQPYEILAREQPELEPQRKYSYNLPRNIPEQHYWPNRPHWNDQQYMQDYIQRRNRPWINYPEPYFPERRRYRGLRRSIAHHDRYCSCPYCTGEHEQRYENYY